LEFLDSIGENNLRELIETWESFKKIPDIFHNQLIRFLKLYYFIGGMPETVSVYIQTNNEQSSRKIQSEIINTYVLDFAKHAPASDIPKLLKIWTSIPGQLAKENKKFIFSAISKSARAKGYEDALNWLENSGLIYKSYQVSSPRFPLNGYANKDAFKIFILDVGLLGALSGLSSNILVKGNSLFTEFNGSFVENYIAQSLTAYKEAKLYYWTSPGIAEVDFLYQWKNRILPLEVKAGINPKSKSLSVYNEKYSPPILSRSTLLNFTSDGKICNYPLYAIQRFPELYLESLTESDSI
jgi:predicted AAA+ superfamily ATPase